MLCIIYYFSHCNISCCSDEQCYGSNGTLDVTERPRNKSNQTVGREHFKSSLESSNEYFEPSVTMYVESSRKKDSARKTLNATTNMTFIFLKQPMTTVLYNTLQERETNTPTENDSTEISGDSSGQHESNIPSTKPELEIVRRTKIPRALPLEEITQPRNNSKHANYDRLLMSLLFVFTIAFRSVVYLS